MSRSSTSVPSTGTAEPCPLCGSYVDLSQEPDGELFAKCAIPKCPGAEKWLPLAEWNSDRLVAHFCTTGEEVFLPPGSCPTCGERVPSRGGAPAASSAPARVLFEQSRARLALVAKEGSPVWGEFRREVEELAPQVESLTITSADETDKIAQATDLHAKLREIRLAAEKEHKALKRDIIDRGNAIDVAKNEIFDAVKPLEQRMLELKEFVKRKAAAETEARQREREEILRGFVDNPETLQLAEMTQADFIALCDFHEARFYAKRDAELKAAAEEAARVKREAHEREAQRAEVERLRTEAVEKEWALAVERQQQAAKAAEAERQRKAADAEHQATLAAERAEYARAHKAAEDKARAAREAIQKTANAQKAAAEAKAAKERAAVAAVAAQEKAAREAAEAELQRQKDEVAAAQRKQQAAADAAAKAPDREKLLLVANLIDEMQLPETATEAGRKVAVWLMHELDQLADKVRARAETL